MRATDSFPKTKVEQLEGHSRLFRLAKPINSWTLKLLRGSRLEFPFRGRGTGHTDRSLAYPQLPCKAMRKPGHHGPAKNQAYEAERLQVERGERGHRLSRLRR